MKIDKSELLEIIKEEILKEQDWLSKTREKVAKLTGTGGKQLSPAPPKKPMTSQELVKQHLELAGKLDLLKRPMSHQGKGVYQQASDVELSGGPGSALVPTGKYLRNYSVTMAKNTTAKASERNAISKAVRDSGLGFVFAAVLAPGAELGRAQSATVTDESRKLGVDWMYFATDKMGADPDSKRMKPMGKVVEAILTLGDDGELKFIPHPDPTLPNWSRYFK